MVSTSLRRLRRRCRKRLESLEIPEPFSVGELCHRLAQQRDRPIHLHELPVAKREDMPCGAWLATSTEDHIVYESGTSPLHRDHIILHELAHMLCGHVFGCAEELAPSLSWDLDSTVPQLMLARAEYTSGQEHEAELLAGLIVQAASHRDSSPLGRLAVALGSS